MMAETSDGPSTLAYGSGSKSYVRVADPEGEDLGHVRLYALPMMSFDGAIVDAQYDQAAGTVRVTAMGYSGHLTDLGEAVLVVKPGKAATVTIEEVRRNDIVVWPVPDKPATLVPWPLTFCAVDWE